MKGSHQIILGRVLDTQADGRGACGNQSIYELKRVPRENRNTAIKGSNCLWSPASAYLEDRARKRIQRSDAQSNNHECIFGVISSLRSMIPGVKQFDKRAHQTDRQNKHTNDCCGARFHCLNILLVVAKRQWAKRWASSGARVIRSSTTYDRWARI